MKKKNAAKEPAGKRRRTKKDNIIDFRSYDIDLEYNAIGYQGEKLVLHGRDWVKRVTLVEGVNWLEQMAAIEDATSDLSYGADEGADVRFFRQLREALVAKSPVKR